MRRQPITTSELRRLTLYVAIDVFELLRKHWACFFDMPSKKRVPRASRALYDARCIGEDSIVHKISKPHHVCATPGPPAETVPEFYYGASAAVVLQHERQRQLMRNQARASVFSKGDTLHARMRQPHCLPPELYLLSPTVKAMDHAYFHIYRQVFIFETAREGSQ